MKRLIAALAAATLLCSPCMAQEVARVHATDLNGRDVELPAHLPADRTLLLIAFRHADQTIVQGWKEGLGLKVDGDWLEIPVIGVGSSIIHGMIRSGMRSKYPDQQARAHVVPMFGDADALARGFGVSPDTITALVVDRSGHVLARATGPFEASGAAGIRRAWRSPS